MEFVAGKQFEADEKEDEKRLVSWERRKAKGLPKEWEKKAIEIKAHVENIAEEQQIARKLLR